MSSSTSTTSTSTTTTSFYWTTPPMSRRGLCDGNPVSEATMLYIKKLNKKFKKKEATGLCAKCKNACNMNVEECVFFEEDLNTPAAPL